MNKLLDLEYTNEIFGNPVGKSFPIKRWFTQNIQGILGTAIFHVFFLILFLIIKIHSFQEIKELGVTIDLTEIKQEEKKVSGEKIKLTSAEVAYLDRLLSQQQNISNRASNVAEKLEKEISTNNYVNQVEQELDQARSEEWKKQKEEIQKKLNQQDFVPENIQKPEEPDIDNYKGLTNISYVFLEPPVDRYKIYLPVPVYKCQGEGTVQVDITVDQMGRVLSSKAFMQQDFPDKDCMIEIAEKYASLTRFEGNASAPKVQKARIVYRFIKQ